MQSAIRINQADEQADKSSKHNLAFAGLFFFTLLLYSRPNDTFPQLFGDVPNRKDRCNHNASRILRVEAWVGRAIDHLAA